MNQTSEETDDTLRSPTDFKVGRVIDEYGLSGLDEELKARWTGTGGERTSLRDLADIINKRILAEELSESGLNPIQSEIEKKYRALKDDVSAGVKTDVENELKHNDIDVDQLTSNFVTHQAVHTYLTEYHKTEFERPDEAEKVENAIETVQRLQSRTLAVTENTVSRLRKTDQLSTGDLEVFVDVSVMCTDCGKQYDIGQLLSEGKCDCPDQE